MNWENKSVFLIRSTSNPLPSPHVSPCVYHEGATPAKAFIMRGPGEFPSVEELIKGSELVVESANVIYPLSSFVVLFITLRTWHESLIYIFIYFNLGKSVQVPCWSAVTLPWPRPQRLRVLCPRRGPPRRVRPLSVGPPRRPWPLPQVQERPLRPRPLWPRRPASPLWFPWLRGRSPQACPRS